MDQATVDNEYNRLDKLRMFLYFSISTDIQLILILIYQMIKKHSHKVILFEYNK